MRLSQIKLAGFKSFVDATKLPLPSNLTAVVGPNGCGKSNLIDAVRWVLGETSMKQLRSSSSEDVIFNGSGSRKPVGRASVELVFDNSDHSLQGPYAHYSEVAVRRELTRDGQSQYFLNGAKCLRRDVVDLFLGTGLGARSGYAIIEQGMVSRMIEARPEELRQWLEEAAGISKYRERRRETESRIRSTRENLSRVNDLCGEVRARARALERQAENARKYKRYREEADRTKVELHFLRTRDVEQQAAVSQERVGQAGTRLQEARRANTAARDQRLRAEVELESARKQFNEQQSAHYTVEAERARAEQSLRHARELADMRARELSQLDQERQRVQQQRAESGAAAERARARETELAERLSVQHQEQTAAQQALEAAEQALEAAGTALQQHDDNARTPLSELAGERARLREREQAAEQLGGRRERLSREAEAHPPPDAQPVRDAEAVESRARETLEAARKAAQQADQLAEEADAQRSALETRVAELRSEVGTLQSELTSLQTLQKAALGDDDAEQRDWLHALGLGSAERLAHRVVVRDGWEAAVEHVLGRLLQAPMAADPLQALRHDGDAPERGASLVRQAEAADAAVAPELLAAQVQAPAAVQRLLAGIHCAGDIAQAEARLQELPEGASVITRDGCWLSRDWVRLPARGSGQGVIARARRLERIEASLREAQQRLAGEAEALESARNAQQEAVADRRRTAQALEQARQAHAAAEQGLQRARQQFELQQNRHAQLQEALAELSDECEQRRRDCEALREAVARRESECAGLAGARQEIEQALVQARADRDAVRGRAGELQQALSELQSQLATARGEAQSATQRMQELEARARQLTDAWQERQQQPAQDTAVQQAQAALDDTSSRLATAQQALSEARLAQEARERDMVAARNDEQKTQAAVEAAQAELQEAQLAHQGLDAQRQMLSARFAEFGVTRDAVADSIDEAAETQQWQERLETLERRIERLGAINLAAIDELAETLARAEELERQHADITEALEQLEAAIRKIDRDTRERFRDTFGRVNERFAERFPKLFGGGEASLELTDDDLLTAGVRVMARPPGKRNTSIHLLSGGEKAMTAVALLLALFELNPAPFCLLDEVDAPLDDANVSRFCDVIREMSSNVQFVIITHNKITMALAEQLHGVTMQEAGSSRLVSVDVQEAVSLAGEAA